MRSATLKNYSKSSQNPPKTLSKPAFEERCVQNASQNSIFRTLGRFLVNFWRAPGAAFWILDDFGPSKMVPKSKRNPQNTLKNRRLKQVYFPTRFFIEFSLILWAQNLKNSNFPKEKQRFLQNQRFRINTEKVRILTSFSEAKTTRNREKVVLKNMCFF